MTKAERISRNEQARIQKLFEAEKMYDLMALYDRLSYREKLLIYLITDFLLQNQEVENK